MTFRNVPLGLFSNEDRCQVLEIIFVKQNSQREGTSQIMLAEHQEDQKSIGWYQIEKANGIEIEIINFDRNGIETSNRYLQI